ncbi:unnamed protein product [Lupinus luteus]|uniref:Uncharacterized protein n=1 Tax=Lupinus luteus TaxID=3873 RepID=A0AAV1WBA8_LUPLU
MDIEERFVIRMSSKKIEQFFLSHVEASCWVIFGTSCVSTVTNLVVKMQEHMRCK